MKLIVLMVATAMPSFAQGQVKRGPEHANPTSSLSGMARTWNEIQVNPNHDLMRRLERSLHLRETGCESSVRGIVGTRAET